jgi:hypothetical protein
LYVSSWPFTNVFMPERASWRVRKYGSKKSRSGFVLCRGPTGFEPCDAEGHSIGQPLNTIDAVCAAAQALGVHVPADGD